MISVSIEPETLSDRDKLKETLDILSKEDPTFISRDDKETGQLIISGMGELHLDVLVTRMLKILSYRQGWETAGNIPRIYFWRSAAYRKL